MKTDRTTRPELAPYIARAPDPAVGVKPKDSLGYTPIAERKRRMVEQRREIICERARQQRALDSAISSVKDGDINKVAAILGVSARYVYRWVKSSRTWKLKNGAIIRKKGTEREWTKHQSA